MIVFYGKSSSGKSACAEKYAYDMSQSNNRRLIYMATMENSSDSAKKRIQRHRALRKDKGFDTIEEMYRVSNHIEQAKDTVILLECVSNLVANILYKRCGGEIPSDVDVTDVASEIYKDIIKLDESAYELIVVTNNVFAYPVNDEWCTRYMRCLGLINKMLAEYSESFFEVTAGVLNVIKE